MGLSHSPSIVTENLEFYIDPSNTRSYPGFGNTIYNIVNSSMGCTFVNFTANPIDNAGNRSIFFDNASNNAVFIPSSNLQFGSSDFTIQFWFKFPGYSNNNGKVIFSDSWGPSNGGFLFYTYQSGGTEKILFYSTSTDGSWNIALEKDLIVSPSFNTWYNVAVTRTGNIFTLYANGQITNNFSSSLSLRNTGLPYSLGASPTAANASKCSIGSVFIYRNKALSAAEINQNYHATKKKYLIEENIVTNGLILNLDPGNPNSYSGAGNTIYDLAGFGNTGTLVSATFSSLNSGSLSGVISKNSSVNSGQNFTVSAWVYPTGFSQRMAIVGNAYPYSTNAGWYFFIANNYFGLNQSVFFSAGVDQVSVGTISYLVSINKWNYVSASVTNGGSSVKIYVNGIEATYGRNSLSNVSLDYSTNEFYVGKRHSATGDGFAGNISQVKIYNRALSATEIQQNYNATKGRFLNALPPVRNGLVLELDAANTSSYSGFGNTWYDLTGNGYNYTLTNGPVFSSFGTTQNFFFDGSNDRALAINPISLGTTHTVSMIIKPSSASEDGILFGDYGHDNTGYAMYVAGGTSIYYSATNYTNISITLSANWIMLTVTRIGTSISLYQNGSLIGSNTLGGNNPLTLSSIADYNGGGFPFGGLFSVVQCYNRALSAYEIKQNFDYYRTRYGI